MSLIEDARRGVITEEMRTVAQQEGVTEDFVRRGVAEGHIRYPGLTLSRCQDMRN